jgi:hypothetical protein
MSGEGPKHKRYCRGCIHILKTLGDGSIRCKVNLGGWNGYWHIAQQNGCSLRETKLLDDQE